MKARVVGAPKKSAGDRTRYESEPIQSPSMTVPCNAAVAVRELSWDNYTTWLCKVPGLCGLVLPTYLLHFFSPVRPLQGPHGLCGQCPAGDPEPKVETMAR